MIKYLIIDDEHIAHEIIKDYCDLLPNMELQKNCFDALEALQYLNKHQVDLIFLDLNMPKLKGFDFLKTLPAPPKVIVTTAYSEFALEGYELNVMDYLLKPFSFERFLKAVNKAMSSTASTQTLSSGVQNPTKPNRLFLRGDKKYTQVVIDDILFIEAAGNYTKVILNNDTITIREKISNLLESLPAKNFLQVHKSFAVATQHINSIEGNRIAIGDHQIPIGKVYRMNVNDLLK
ncbi:MAG: LytTR family DNA-binding domain-containing protein [Reichenbachiella sp.]|uniref:LytR/AlgR family response regulator transcription factor n=1 Tax=Reichenbachiella sp. TaxID=2184521 RepID=UPI003264AE0A